MNINLIIGRKTENAQQKQQQNSLCDVQVGIYNCGKFVLSYLHFFSCPAFCTYQFSSDRVLITPITNIHTGLDINWWIQYKISCSLFMHKHTVCLRCVCWKSNFFHSTFFSACILCNWKGILFRYSVASFADCKRVCKWETRWLEIFHSNYCVVWKWKWKILKMNWTECKSSWPPLSPARFYTVKLWNQIISNCREPRKSLG